jgi:hypothetical protein
MTATQKTAAASAVLVYELVTALRNGAIALKFAAARIDDDPAYKAAVRADADRLVRLAEGVKGYLDADAVVNADTDAVSDDDYARALAALTDAQNRLLAAIREEGASTAPPTKEG